MEDKNIPDWALFRKRVKNLLGNTLINLFNKNFTKKITCKSVSGIVMDYCIELKQEKPYSEWSDKEIIEKFKPWFNKQDNIYKKISDEREEGIAKNNVKIAERKKKSQENETIILPTEEHEKLEVKKGEKTKTKVPKKVKDDVWKTYIGEEIARHKCLSCKMTTIDKSNFDCGHVISEANGGGLEIKNLRPICAGCNHSMGVINMVDYVKKHGYFIGGGM